MIYLKELTKDMEYIPSYNELGERCSIINRESQPNEFEKAYPIIYNLPDVSGKEFKFSEINPEIYCIVVSEGGKKMFTLYKSNYYYLVGENGKTLQNLTFK